MKSISAFIERHSKHLLLIFFGAVAFDALTAGPQLSNVLVGVFGMVGGALGIWLIERTVGE
jgi:hypothetical protein